MFQYDRRVEFADTDAAGLVHFTALLRYMEEAEHALYRSLGFSGFEWQEESVHGIPWVQVQCDFSGPVYFGEVVRVQLRVRRIGRSSVKYEAECTTSEDERGQRPVASASWVKVFARREHGTRVWRSAPVPSSVKDKLDSIRTDP